MNFMLIGGGGGGPWSTIGAGAWVIGGVTGVGISTYAWKMFRPLPSYFVCSLARSRSVRSVGSSELIAFGFDFAAERAAVVVAGAAWLGLLKYARATRSRASTP